MSRFGFAHVLIESDCWIDLSQRVFKYVLREVNICVSLRSLTGSMWLLRCLRNDYSDHYSRSGGGGMLGGVIYKDSKVGPKSFVF